VYEVIVYNRTLSSAELSAATAALEQSYGIQPINCSYVPPPKLDCTALASSLNAGLPSAAQIGRLATFVGALRAKGPALTATLPYAMASMAQDYVAGFERRCTGMTRGHILPLRTPASTLKSLTDLLSTAGELRFAQILPDCLIFLFSTVLLGNAARSRHRRLGGASLRSAIVPSEFDRVNTSDPDRFGVFLTHTVTGREADCWAQQLARQPVRPQCRPFVGGAGRSVEQVALEALCGMQP
jgi:hypothetical protein